MMINKIWICVLFLSFLSCGAPVANVTITNLLPTISAITLSPGSQVQLQGSGVTVSAGADISDGNGYQDLNQNGSYCLWSGQNSTLNFLNCTNTTCTVMCNKTFTSSYETGNYSITIVALDVYNSTNQSTTFYFYNPPAVHPPSYSYSSVISTVTPPATAGCSLDVGCTGSQKCVNGACVDVGCDCGDVQDHVCAPHQCCSDAACKADQQCTSNSCVAITGTCGYAGNHTWMKHACCLDGDCSPKERCKNNRCVAKTLPLQPNITSESVFYTSSEASSGVSLVLGVLDFTPTPVQILLKRSVVVEKNADPSAKAFVTTITIFVTNNQSQPLKNVKLIEMLPDGMPADSSEISFSETPEVIDAGLVSWTFENIDPGETKTAIYTIYKEINVPAIMGRAPAVVTAAARKPDTNLAFANFGSLLPDMGLDPMTALAAVITAAASVAGYLGLKSILRPPRIPKSPSRIKPNP